MIRSLITALGVALFAVAAGHALAKAPPEPPVVTDPALAPPRADVVNSKSESNSEASPGAIDTALRDKLASLPTEGSAQEIKERAVLSDFYAAHHAPALWVSAGGLTPKGAAVVVELMKAGDWGLDARDFTLPKIADAATANLDPAEVADAEVALSLAVLKYARFARGGRIIDPAILLNSNLDRKPQLIDPETVFNGIASADAPDAYLRGLHPKQPQFEKLRQAYLAKRNKPAAKRLLANMEQWRWMPDDLGEVHILANIPEFMVYFVKQDKVIHTERIVVGETGKQTTVFSRPLKTIVFKPLWRVPESIKVRELWPNLRRGGSMFPQHDLQLETKDGQPLDYRSINWNTADIRDYEVVQPPGRKNVMGVVKFTFPSQHTIFMHDTIDKWMFAQSRRTLSHGCLRLRNPMRMAELVLAEDKGWDAARVDQTMREGPRNNEIVVERKIPMHLVYFTAWVDDAGRVRMFGDIYGHERRITLALEGKWDEIDIGSDHLTPPEPAEPATIGAPVAQYQRRREPTIVDIVGNALGGGN